MLGFTDPKALPKILSDFWSPTFPDGQLADASDKRIAQLAYDFLQQKGSELWSVRGRGPVYPDDAEEIRPKIFDILKRQRRNQLDIRIKRSRRHQIDSEDPLREEDVTSSLMNGRCDTSSQIMIDHDSERGDLVVDLTEEARESQQDLNDNEADNIPPAPALPSAQSASMPDPFPRSGIRIVFPAQRNDTSNTVQAPSLRAFSAPAVRLHKRGFEEMSSDISPTTSANTTQLPDGRKRLVTENAFLAPRAENEVRPSYRPPTVETELGSQSTRPNSAESHRLGTIGQENALSEQTPRTTEGVGGPICDNGIAQGPRLQPPDNGVGYPAPKDAAAALHPCPVQISPSDQELQASKQGESISYELYQNSYSVDHAEAPGLLRFLLKHCEHDMIQNRWEMRDGLTVEDRSSARRSFLAYRKMLDAFQKEGFRVGAQLNF